MLYLVLCMLLLSGSRAEYSGEDDPETMQDFIRERCLENADESSLEELEAVLNNFVCCFAPPSEETAEENWCTDFREINYHCVVNLAEKLDSCLNFEEEYIAEFLIATYNATCDTYCSNENTDFKDQLLSMADSQCNTTGQEMLENTAMECLTLENIEIESNLNKEILPEYISERVDCITESLNTQCESPLVELVANVFNTSLVVIEEHTFTGFDYK